MIRSHIAAATIATAALALSPALASPANAVPSGGHSQVKQLVKDINGKDRQLARLATARRTTSLADDHEQAIVDAITADRADLATLKAEAEAADSAYDARAVRRDLRSFRVENYVIATNQVRRAERLAAAAIAAGDPDALALVDAGLAAALAVTADSPKSDVVAVWALLAAADDDLADPTDDDTAGDPGSGTTDPVDPVTDPVDPSTDPSTAPSNVTA